MDFNNLSTYKKYYGDGLLKYSYGRRWSPCLSVGVGVGCGTGVVEGVGVTVGVGVGVTGRKAKS